MNTKDGKLPECTDDGSKVPHLHKLAFEVAVELEMYAEEMAAIADFLAEKH